MERDYESIKREIMREIFIYIYRERIRSIDRQIFAVQKVINREKIKLMGPLQLSDIGAFLQLIEKREYFILFQVLTEGTYRKEIRPWCFI